MIQRIENPLNLELEQVEGLIPELQRQFDENSQLMGDFFTLEESGVSIEITLKTGQYNYDLQQLKGLKAEMLDPVMNSAKEIS